MSDTVRSFFCVPLPATLSGMIAARIDGCRKAERKCGVHPFRWVKRNQLHITLRFCGELSCSSVKKLGDKVGEVLAGFPAGECFPGRFGTFGNPPRVLLVHVNDRNKILRDLNLKIENICDSCGLERERRRFIPHLTLARTGRDFSGDMPLPSSVFALPEGMSVPVDRVLLMRSDLSPSGASYSIIREFVLRNR